MKNTLLFALALFIATFSVQAQSTVDSIAAKYQLLPMPEPLTIEKTFPVLGSYQLAAATEEQGAVTIALDSANSGIVWISGLPQGTFKAYLKKAPATYRILSQKTSTGKQIPEGTLIYDSEAKTLNLALGAPFNEEDPAAVFASATTQAGSDDVAKVKTKASAKKSKAKVTFYTATKIEAAPEAATARN